MCIQIINQIVVFFDKTFDAFYVRRPNSHGECAVASAMQINRLQFIQSSALPLLVDEIVDVIPQGLVSWRQESSQFPMREW